MKYVEMILSIDDANIIQFPSLLDRVVKWKEQGIKFIRMVTDTIRPSEVIHLSGASNKQHVSTKLTFNDIYDAIKQPTEQNFTILKCLYNKVDSEIILKIINTPISSNNKYIMELLHQSDGYMIYKHQMQQFIVDKMGDVERMNYVSSNPMLNKISLGLSIQSLMEKRNQQYFMPQISLFSDIGSQEFKWQFNKKSVYIMGGLQLSMPLWTNKINKIKGEQIQLDIKALEWNKVLVEQQDKLAIDVAKNKLLSSKAAFMAMEKQVSTSGTYLRLTEKGFQNGTVSLLEMYDAQNQYTTALLQENLRYFQFLMALADLQKLI
jgi:Ran GTPase-activating protein (RanGAP) involved in mRNA processing and transport